MRYTTQPSFELGPEITQEQLDFFDQHGFIHFRNVASDEEVDAIIQAMDEMEHQFISEDREFVMGVPIQWGVDHENKKYINRFAYASIYSKIIRAFVLDSRFEPIRRFIGENSRLAEREKDGVVINNFINIEGSNYKKLGWHTDSP
ncbi:MAG: phytanoyl-CoA dioxygenase, partial [Myxococcota bacterium]|nr:phytanoyl-CoA dioxygenase [Myxococcota bacterium]